MRARTGSAWQHGAADVGKDIHVFDAIAARLPRVLKLEDPVFGEIGNDNAATVQAVVVTAIAGVIGNLTAEGGFAGKLLTGLLIAPIGLFIWTAIVFVVGKLFGGQGTYIQLLRPMGYAAAPFALGIVPVVGGLAGLVYTAFIQVRAVKEINQVSPSAAVGTVLIPLGLIVGFVLLLAAIGFALLTGLGGFGSS